MGILAPNCLLTIIPDDVKTRQSRKIKTNESLSARTIPGGVVTLTWKGTLGYDVASAELKWGVKGLAPIYTLFIKESEHLQKQRVLPVFRDILVPLVFV